ncbi:MAG: DUF2950 domain-containing protein [Deltaproteobacteria bacterium]|nr:DUF2950 domain-containing protein [Deltaproteobacteria bacterium]
MEAIQQKCVFHMLRGMTVSAMLLVIAAVVFAWSMPAAGALTQRLFSSPEDAVKALTDAVKAKDETAIDQIFGPSGKDLHSGDKVQDAAEFDELASNLAEKTSLVKESDSRVLLHIGNENWPFPIPIVKKDGQWFFDTEAGKEEILNRRIGENELTAILVCRTYVKAQREYTLKDWDGDGIFAYAQKLRSDRGKRNGLFWRSAPGEAVSPLGELVAKARVEGYKKEKAVFKEEKPSPFHGYYFKILTGQGKNAPGGKYNYIINGNMVGGFALVAFPANWGKSGVMTFIVNQQGKVYQKNLGPDTLKTAGNMKVYNPDKTWTPVQE